MRGCQSVTNRGFPGTGLLRGGPTERNMSTSVMVIDHPLHRPGLANHRAGRSTLGPFVPS